MLGCRRKQSITVAILLLIVCCGTALALEPAETEEKPALRPYGTLRVAEPGFPTPHDQGIEDMLVARGLEHLSPGEMHPQFPPPSTTMEPAGRQAENVEACARSSALGTSRTLAVNTSGGLKVGFKSYRQSLQLEDKEVVLTFDDGPVPPYTNRVLDALKTECVKATFFLVGRYAQTHPEIVRREIADGHTIGHHSWSHPEKTLRGMSPEAARSEIVDGISAVQVASGQEPYRDGKPRTPFFRFPGFADTPALNDLLRTRDIGVFGADLWASDWTLKSPETQLRLIMQRLEADRRGIILFHDTQAQTASMLPAFLAELKAKGYRVVHIVPGSGSSNKLRNAPASWTSETEAILTRVMPRLLRSKTGPETGHDSPVHLEGAEDDDQRIVTIRKPDHSLKPPPVSSSPSLR